MSKGKILILGSNGTRIEIHGGTGPTGQYLNETVVPAMAFVEDGYEVVLATPSGEKPFIDPASDKATHFGGDEAAYQAAKDFWANDPSMKARTLRSVIDEGLGNYAAIFTPGGQGPVVDLMQDEDMGVITRYFHEHKKPSAFLCHGPIATAAALPNAKAFRAALIAEDNPKAAELARGWQYAGYRMTVFTATEEHWIEDTILHGKLFFNMPEALTLAGGKVDVQKDFEPYVVVDRELITGQNPRSDHAIAAALMKMLAEAAVPA